MFLDVGERLQLLQILNAQREDIAGLKSILRTTEVLSFSPDEVAGLKFQQDGAQLKWDLSSEFNMPKEIPIDQWLTDKIRDILQNLNIQHQLTQGLASLYEKFITDYQ